MMAASEHSRVQRKFARWAVPAAALVVYGALVAWMIPRHEPWADEAQAWELASHLGLGSLFHTYIHYEISPGLWHVLLWALAKAHGSYAGLHWFSAAVAAMGMAAVMFWAPFPMRVRVLLPFTYYFVYQYAVVARSYVLFPALLFGVAAMWPDRMRRLPVVCLLVGLLGNTTAHGLVVGLGLAVVLAIEGWGERCDVRVRREGLASALVLLVLLGFAGWCLMPAADADWLAGAKALGSPVTRQGAAQQFLVLQGGLRHVPMVVAVAVALGVRFASVLWSSLTSYAMLGIAAWILMGVCLVRRGLVRYAVPVVLLAGFCTVTRFNAYHGGLVWTLFVFLWWVTWPAGSFDVPRRLLFVAVALCMAQQAGWALHAMQYDYRNSYSPDRDAAPFLAEYKAKGQRVDVAIADHHQTPGHNEFFAVGLEPYFVDEPLNNMRARFWIWRSDDEMRQQYLRDVQDRSTVVLLEEAAENAPGWATEDVRLRSRGYRPVRSICGKVYYPWSQASPLCHVFYEPPR